jgi:mono/diheme cytochrome c family protein
MLRIASIAVSALLVAAAALGQDRAQRGMQVYAAQKCSICHSIADKGNKKGPLDNVGTKLKADEIREWIVKAPEMATKAKAVRKPPMKAYPNLAKEDLDGLVDYMLTLKKS